MMRNITQGVNTYLLCNGFIFICQEKRTLLYKLKTILLSTRHVATTPNMIIGGLQVFYKLERKTIV
jgi:hypothetical protein